MVQGVSVVGECDDLRSLAQPQGLTQGRRHARTCRGCVRFLCQQAEQRQRVQHQRSHRGRETGNLPPAHGAGASGACSLVEHRLRERPRLPARLSAACDSRSHLNGTALTTSNSEQPNKTSVFSQSNHRKTQVHTPLNSLTRSHSSDLDFTDYRQIKNVTQPGN